MKYLFTLMLIFCTLYGNCQIEKPIKKGNITLGGSVGFGYSAASRKSIITDSYGQSFEGTTDQKTMSVYLNPGFGYFVVDGLVIGISPSFSYTHDKYSGFIRNSYSIGITPFAKYYFNNGFFAGFKASYHFSISKQPGYDYSTKYNQISIRPSLGYAIFINSKVSLEPSLEYSFEKAIGKNDMISDDNLKVHQIYFNIGFNIFL